MAVETASCWAHLFDEELSQVQRYISTHYNHPCALNLHEMKPRTCRCLELESDLNQKQPRTELASTTHLYLSGNELNRM